MGKHFPLTPTPITLKYVTSTLNDVLMKKSDFLLLLIAFCLFMSSCQSNSTDTSQDPSVGEVITSAYYQEAHRPQFHFSPDSMWMNDPNGMVFFEGEYHLFYQYYPDSNVWGPMHWGHAVSPDLVHWEHLPIALYPDEKLGYIFSGSAVVDWKNSSGLGKDNEPPLIAIFTYHDPKGEKSGSDLFQTQGIAYSHDKGRTWTQYAENPVIENPGIRDFRDPKVSWHEASQQWVMIFAAKDRVRLYTSPNLKDWTFASEFGEKLGTHAGVWECPDLFELPIEGTQESRWVMLVSINPGGPNGGSATQYFVGDFDGKTFSLDPHFAGDVPLDAEQAVWLEYGRDNYAGVTWADIPVEDGRRIFMGWMSNWDYATRVPTTRWRSAMTLPRILSLQQTPAGLRVFSFPSKEVEKLRKNPVSINITDINGSQNLTVPPPQGGFNLNLEFNTEQSQAQQWGIELSNRLGEKVRMGFDASTNEYFIDRTQSGNMDFADNFSSKDMAPRLAQGSDMKWQLWIDRASVELFADEGQTVMTEIFFPTEAFTQIALFSEGGTAKLTSGTIAEVERIW